MRTFTKKILAAVAIVACLVVLSAFAFTVGSSNHSQYLAPHFHIAGQHQLAVTGGDPPPAGCMN